MSTALPIDSAPKGVRIPGDRLNALNLAMARALLAESHAREADARLAAAKLAAQQAAREFAALHDQVSAELGVQLGQIHGWDEHTGEVREAQKPDGSATRG